MILFGFKNAGKTYLGKQLSKHLNRSFIDTDDLMHSKYQQSVRELFRKVGAVQFRKIEQDVIQNLPTHSSSIIAVGGGAVLNPENVKVLQTIGQLIYLKVSFETVQKRVLEQGTPAFAGSLEELKQIYLQRLPIYESIPAICIDIDHFDSEYDILRAMQKGIYGI